MNCPHCNSINIKNLPLVYEEGLSDIRMTSNTTAVGRGGVAFGTTETSGVSQTALSKQASPPKKESTIKLALMHIVGFLVTTLAISGIFKLGGTNLMGFISLGYILLALFHLYKNLMFNIRRYPALYQEWQNSFFCSQCGNIFTP